MRAAPALVLLMLAACRREAPPPPAPSERQAETLDEIDNRLDAEASRPQ